MGRFKHEPPQLVMLRAILAPFTMTKSGQRRVTLRRGSYHRMIVFTDVRRHADQPAEGKQKNHDSTVMIHTAAEIFANHFVEGAKVSHSDYKAPNEWSDEANNYVPMGEWTRWERTTWIGYVPWGFTPCIPEWALDPAVQGMAIEMRVELAKGRRPADLPMIFKDMLMEAGSPVYKEDVDDLTLYAAASVIALCRPQEEPE